MLAGIFQAQQQLEKNLRNKPNKYVFHMLAGVSPRQSEVAWSERRSSFGQRCFQGPWN